MGCAVTIMNKVKPLDSSSESESSMSEQSSSHQSSNRSDSFIQWKIMPSQTEARRKYFEDGSFPELNDVNPEFIALRALLDDPLAQSALGKFASLIEVVDVFMCWVDIQEYKSIPAESYRRSKALHIYHKYIKEDAVWKIDMLSNMERKYFNHCISFNSKTIPRELIHVVQFKPLSEPINNDGLAHILIEERNRRTNNVVGGKLIIPDRISLVADDKLKLIKDPSIEDCD